jgi:hypothetical protein
MLQLKLTNLIKIYVNICTELATPIIVPISDNLSLSELSYPDEFMKSGPVLRGILQSIQCAKLFLQSLELGLPHPLTRRRVCPYHSVCPLVGIGTLPPLPQASVSLPTEPKGGGGTLACG